MKINIKHNNNTYILNLNKTYDISIPLNFDGQQPNFYNVINANMKPLETNSIFWSVSKNQSISLNEIME